MQNIYTEFKYEPKPQLGLKLDTGPCMSTGHSVDIEHSAALHTAMPLKQSSESEHPSLFLLAGEGIQYLIVRNNALD